jgi:hypothetical protein
MLGEFSSLGLIFFLTFQKSVSLCEVCVFNLFCEDLAIMHSTDLKRMDSRSLKENLVPRDIKMSSSLCYGRIQKRENHVAVFSHNTRKRTF